MLSGYISKTEHLGSLVFRVTMVGHVVTDGILAGELKTSDLELESTSTTVIARAWSLHSGRTPCSNYSDERNVSTTMYGNGVA